MSNRRLPLLILLLVLSNLLPVAAAEPPSKPEPTVLTVADLAWIAGDWEGTMGGDTIEERWLPPAAGAMLGMFRWVTKDGKVDVYELLSIEPDSEGPTLWLRHFGPKLLGREDKDGAIPFYLGRVGPGEVMFDNRDPEKHIRLGYRKDGGRGLVAILERQRDGKWVSDEFRYSRR